MALETEKDARLKLLVVKYREEGKSEDYIQSFVNGWFKEPSKENQGAKKKRK